ncbi:hypothetical protein CHUAL_009806 [Chamberlinius hualienensis]
MNALWCNKDWQSKLKNLKTSPRYHGLFNNRTAKNLESHVELINPSPEIIFKDILNCNEELYASIKFHELVQNLPRMRNVETDYVPRNKAEQIYLYLSRVGALKEKTQLMREKHSFSTIEPFGESLFDALKAITEVKQSKRFQLVCQMATKIAAEQSLSFSPAHLLHVGSLKATNHRPFIECLVEEVKVNGTPLLSHFVHELGTINAAISSTFVFLILTLNAAYLIFRLHTQIRISQQFEKQLPN